MWHMLGDAAKLRMNDQRQKILEALTTTPQSPQQITTATKIKLYNVQKLLQRMYVDGLLERRGHRQYHLGAASAWQ
jgi:DNA-binding IclR family transcriptional regulator